MNFEHFLATLPGLLWICLVIPALFALAGVFCARKFIGPNNARQYRDIANAVLGPVATIFGILAAFIVATTWAQFSTTENNIIEEGNALRGVYFSARALTPDYCEQIQTLCKRYSETVLKNEWKIVQRGIDNRFADEILYKLSNLYLAYPLKNEKENIYFQRGIEKLDNLKKYRDQRISDSSTGLLPMLWFLFLMGGTTLISVSLLMISSPGKTHGAMVILLAMMIGMMIYAIISLDFPFEGFTQVNTKSFMMLPMEENK